MVCVAARVSPTVPPLPSWAASSPCRHPLHPPHPAVTLLTLPSPSSPCHHPPHPAITLTLPSPSSPCHHPSHLAVTLLTLPSPFSPCRHPPHPAVTLFTLSSPPPLLPAHASSVAPPPLLVCRLLPFPSFSPARSFPITSSSPSPRPPCPSQAPHRSKSRCAGARGALRELLRPGREFDSAAGSGSDPVQGRSSLLPTRQDAAAEVQRSLQAFQSQVRCVRVCACVYVCLGLIVCVHVRLGWRVLSSQVEECVCVCVFVYVYVCFRRCALLFRGDESHDTARLLVQDVRVRPPRLQLARDGPAVAMATAQAHPVHARARRAALHVRAMLGRVPRPARPLEALQQVRAATKWQSARLRIFCRSTLN